MMRLVIILIVLLLISFSSY
ncbi:type I toxin-antitoxin system toxin IbsC [Shigella boydii]|nr:hypothetical protein [Shigella boydii]EFV7689243.1 type I toxin-antitoxin system toxin IbsC [Shigella boydii]EFX6079792.1 type I toxin-antitoxin system Ibs family toxin [Shigella boydii]EFZ3801302.1 type I toxin-antitoxin system toxin IbsC [Shigella boydii]EHY3019995.1 type I toxin-antitoxin system toxin IbsC [Shigella boydii]